MSLTPATKSVDCVFVLNLSPPFHSHQQTAFRPPSLMPDHCSSLRPVLFTCFHVPSLNHSAHCWQDCQDTPFCFTAAVSVASQIPSFVCLCLLCSSPASGHAIFSPLAVLVTLIFLLSPAFCPWDHGSLVFRPYLSDPWALLPCMLQAITGCCLCV